MNAKPCMHEMVDLTSGRCEGCDKEVMGTECVACGARSEGNVWKDGEVLLFGMLFACSTACAENYARHNAAPGYRPGEPGFAVEVHRDELESPKSEAT